MRKHHYWLCGALLAAPAFAQTENNPLEISIAPTAESRTVWRHGNFNINVKPSASLTAFSDNHIYAMVLYSADTALEQKLRNDPRLQQFQEPDPVTHRGFAMIRVTNLEELEEYAEMAHEGLGCGNIQVIDLKDTVTSYIAVTDPVFAPTQKIDAVQKATDAATNTKWRGVVESMVAHGTRFHTNANKEQVVNTVKTAWETAAGGKIPGFTIETVSHTSTQQKSVVAKIPGTTEATTTVIIGSHLDSTSTNNNTAPGADDNATGVATVAEIIRAVAELGWKFNRSVEFHAYAAEEIGLNGSAAIASSYKSSGRAVASMMQIDMNGYSDSDKIWLVKEDSSTTLKRGLMDLANTYLGGNVGEASLTAGTSDHKSWTSKGFQAAFPFENPNGHNPDIHTPNDTIDKFNQPNLPLRFIKLGVAYLAHYAGFVADSTGGGGSTPGGGTTPGGGGSPGTVNNDIKIALTRGSNANQFYLTAATGAQYAVIEACRVSPTNTQVCGNEIIQLNYATKKGTRYFYAEDFQTATMQAGEQWRFHGYDNSNRLAARRDVILSAKTGGGNNTTP